MSALLKPLDQLKFAKFVTPNIFENATPKLHITLLDFLNKGSRFSAVILSRGFGKSTLLNKIHILSRIFFKHEKYTMIVSENEGKAKSFLRDIKRMIDDAALLRLDIRRGAIWNEKMIEIVVNASSPEFAHFPPEKRGYRCAVVAYGAGEDPRGYLYDNSRPTFIISDDIESRELVKSKVQREKLAEWFFQDLVPALHPEGEILIIGTIMHAEQLISRIRDNPQWDTITLGCYDENGESRWKSRFSKEDLEAIRHGFEAQGLFNAFPNEYLCIPQNEAKQLFQRDDYRYFERIRYSDKVTIKKFKDAKGEYDIKIYEPIAIVLSDGSEIPYIDLKIYTTMDLASDGKDRTCIFTVGYDTAGNEYNLDISSGHWNPFEKSIQALRVQAQFHPIRFGIEKAGAQNDFFYTIDVAQKEYGIRIPVDPLSHGGVNKNIRISNLQPTYLARKIYHNRSDKNNAMYEAQLGNFNIDIQSSVDDMIDARAYQLQYVVNRSFENIYVDDKYNVGAWE